MLRFIHLRLSLSLPNFPLLLTITVASSRSLSSTPKNTIETTLSSSTTPTFNWIDNHAIRYPFPIADNSNETIDIIEYQTTGTLMASFLKADAMSIQLN